MKLAEKQVVVVGGSSGIGFAVAQQAISEGARVHIASSNADRLNAAVARLGSNARGVTVDARDAESVANFFGQVGHFDHLVYTAGDWAARAPKPVSELGPEDFEQALAVRFSGALMTISRAVSRINDGGSITLTGGLVSRRPRKGAPLNTAMAGAIEHLVRGLAVDLAPLRVNAVVPGLIGTEVWGDNAADTFKDFIETLPIKQIGKPEDAAEAYIFLMKCGYITGDTILVDGGKSLV